MGGRRERRGGRPPCLSARGGKHLVLRAVGLAAGVSARPVGLAQLGPKGFLQVRAPSPNYTGPPSSPGCGPVTGWTEELLSRFPDGDSELTWDRAGARDQPESLSGEPEGPAGGRGPELPGGRDPQGLKPRTLCRDLAQTARESGPTPRWSFQTLPLRVPKEIPASCPQGLCDHRVLQTRQPSTSSPWPGPKLVGFPSLPVLYPVFFLPWARPDPVLKPAALAVFPKPFPVWVEPSRSIFLDLGPSPRSFPFGDSLL